MRRDTERQSLGYGDYVALSCDQLGQETVNLMRAAADRSHHVLADDQARRENATDLVKQAYATALLRAIQGTSLDFWAALKAGGEHPRQVRTKFEGDLEAQALRVAN